MSASSSDDGFIIPPGYSPPFAIVTDSDHTAWILIATALGLACSLLFGGIRTFIRCTICPGVRWDDVLLASATILAIFESSIILDATSHGLGRSIELIPTHNHSKVQQLYYSGVLLFIISVGLSKLSVIFFLLRITSVKRHRQIFYSAAACTGAWTIGSLFALALQCDLSHPWDVIGSTCSNAALRWQVICAFDIVIEICIVCMSVYLVWSLQTSLSTKAIVVSTFSFRLLMILPIAFRLANFENVGRDSNITLLDDLFVVWTQTEMNYSLIAATIPSLRPFASNLNTQFGGLGEGESAYGHSGSRSSTKDRHDSDATYRMSTTKSIASSNDTRKSVTTTGRPSVSKFSGNPADHYSYDIQAANPPGNEKGITTRQGLSIDEIMTTDSHSLGSHDSQHLKIMKEVTYRVEHEAAP